MSRNGAGTYSLPEAPFVFDTVISETAVNSNFSDIANALTASIAKDGQTTPTANLPMGGYKHTGVTTSSGSASRSEYLAAATAQDGGIWDAGDTGGTSTAYTATLAPSITAYADKQLFRVKFNAACGANPTINFNTVAAKKIYKNVSGTATQLAANDVPQNYIGVLRYDTALDAAAGGFWLVNASDFNINSLTVENTVAYYDDFLPFYDASASANRKLRPEYLLGLLRGHLYGLTITNNGTDANNDMDIAAGQAVDNTDFALMVLSSALVKRLDAAWAVGTNQGGLDTGSKANSTTYYIHLIQRSDTGVVDALFSTSATSPTMPTNYDRSALIGWCRTDGSGNILSGQIGQALNGGGYRSVSQQETITSPLTFTHGIPSLTPLNAEVQMFLVNTTDELGYVAGDVVPLDSSASAGLSSASSNTGTGVKLSSSALTVRFGSGGLGINNFTNGNASTINNANWKFVAAVRVP